MEEIEALRERFQELIANESRKFRDVEEYNFDELLENIFSSKEDIDATINMKNIKTNKIEKVFSNYADITFLNDYDVENYIFITEYSAIRHKDEICNIIYDALANQTNFNEDETVILIDSLCDEFYDSYASLLDDEDEELADLYDNYEDLIDYVKFIADSSAGELTERFFDDEDFSETILGDFIYDYIQFFEHLEDEYLERQQEEAHKQIQTINDFARNKILNILDNLQANGYEEYKIQFVADYLVKNISLFNINKEVASLIFTNIEEEIKLKPYEMLIIIYDFYISAMADKRTLSDSLENKYLTYIDKHSLKDILMLFKTDCAFRMTAIMHFDLLNSFERSLDDDTSKDFQEKFAMVYKLDTMARNYQNSQK